MLLPEAIHLSQCIWGLFGTLTYKVVPSESRQECMWHALMREVAGSEKVWLQAVIWARRWELGELNKREHFHFLLAGLPDSSFNTSTCFRLMYQWESLRCGGMARIRVYDRTLHGVQYISDCLMDEREISGANLYESKKFVGGRSELVVSESFNRVRLASLRRSGVFSFEKASRGSGGLGLSVTACGAIMRGQKAPVPVRGCQPAWDSYRNIDGGWAGSCTDYVGNTSSDPL